MFYDSTLSDDEALLFKLLFQNIDVEWSVSKIQIWNEFKKMPASIEWEKSYYKKN